MVHWEEDPELCNLGQVWVRGWGACMAKTPQVSWIWESLRPVPHFPDGVPEKKLLHGRSRPQKVRMISVLWAQLQGQPWETNDPGAGYAMIEQTSLWTSNQGGWLGGWIRGPRWGGLLESDVPPPPLLNGLGNPGASMWGNGTGDPQFGPDLVSILQQMRSESRD